MRAGLSAFGAILLTAVLVSCGGYNNSSSSTAATSKIANRVFVSNNFQGFLNIIDADKDILSPSFTINLGGTPSRMYLSQDKSTTMVFDSRNNIIDTVDNTTEARVSSINLGDISESFFSSKDGKVGYAAVRNVALAGTLPGVLEVMDIRGSNGIVTSIPITNLRFISPNNAVTKLLAFSDNSDTVFMIDLTAAALTPVPVTGTFSRPVAAYFSADDSKAYVLSCGFECGGTQAMVTEVTFPTAGAPVTTRSVNVAAARVGNLQGTTLYVSGTPNAADCNALAQPGNCGAVQKVDVSAMTASTAVSIGLGSHTVMNFAANKVWIGAQNCLGGGCLSIYDPTANTATVDNPLGDVTSMTTVPRRDVMYVIEGGELRILSTTTGAPTPTQVDIVGAAYGVVSVSQ